jgi:hypothetical protein
MFRKAIIGEKKSVYWGINAEITWKLKIHAIKTSAFHLQTNGQTERFNRTLMNILSIYMDTHQKNWDIYYYMYYILIRQTYILVLRKLHIF